MPGACRYDDPIDASTPMTGPDETPGRAWHWRGVVSFACLTVSIVCLIVGSLFVWMRATAYNPDGYVAAALTVQGQVELKNAITEYVEDDVLSPEKAQDLALMAVDPLPINTREKDLLATVIAASARSQVGNAVEAFLSSRAGRDIGLALTTRASEEIVRLLRDETGAFDFQGDAIVFRTEPIVKEVRANLEGRLGGLAKYLPAPREEDFRTYTVVQGDVVTATQKAITVIDLMSWLLPLIFLVLLVAGLVIARERRAAAFRVMIAIAVSAVVVIVGIQIARRTIVGLVTDPASENVVTAILDTASTRLIDQTLWLALCAAVIGGILWLLGPDHLARRARAWMAARWRDLDAGSRSPAGRVTDVARRWRFHLEVGGLALAAIILVIMPDVTTSTWILALVALVIWGLLIEYANCAGWIVAGVRRVRAITNRPTSA